MPSRSLDTLTQARQLTTRLVCPILLRLYPSWIQLQIRRSPKVQTIGQDYDSSNSINLKRDITKNALEFENNQMISFIDRYCIEDSYAIFQFCTIQGRLLNKKLRFLLEGRGLYNFEIDLYIIKGSCATRLAMLDRIDL